MTANQVRALEFQESQRANRERESIQSRQNELTARETARKAKRDTWEEREAQKKNAIDLSRTMSENELRSAQTSKVPHDIAQGYGSMILKGFGKGASKLIG